MRFATSKKGLHRLAAALALSASLAAAASESDHREFDATLHAPYQADAGRRDARTFTLVFDYPHLTKAQRIRWRLELLNPRGLVVRRWHGLRRLAGKPVSVSLRWKGRARSAWHPDGVYRVRMIATALGTDEQVEQAWTIAVGRTPAPAMPAFGPMRTKAAPKLPLNVPAIASLPYTVWFANLHSQTNHSDGGADVSKCKGAQKPLAAPFGPVDAFAYAQQRGLDILMVSEHNHMFDGSAGTNTSATPAAARALYQSGLAAAFGFNAINPGFLAMYGMEWGVIDKGGHLNIFNSLELLQWERNSDGELIGDTLTAKGDYAALYTLMRQRGWVGQFNHPAIKNQFLVNGVALGYTADGDETMVLCEVLNTLAFSSNTTETETRRSNYEMACNKALEAGYHVAFATNQDNHCANWGASYTNRTGVLIPNGVPLTQASFIDALRARRVYATMDKHSQLVLTANGHIMGERFINSGPLHLVANFASTGGKTVSTVEIFEGVPGRNGTVSLLSNAANTKLTPTPGEHFYYARLTQNDGNILWSAPVWVTQR